MRERLVGFGHAMHVFFLLDGRAAVVGRVQQFVGQLVGHAFFAAAARVRDQPADRQRGAPVGIDLDRDLVVGAAHAAGLDFQQRLAVFDRLLEQLQAFIAALLLQLVDGFVEDALGGRLLARPHHRVHKLGHQVRLIHRIRGDSALGNMSFARHEKSAPGPSLLALSLSRGIRALLLDPETLNPSPALAGDPRLTPSHCPYAFFGRLAPYFERPWLRLATPTASSVPRTTWYRTPGRSFTRPPRMSTIECSCRLWPMPGIYVVTSIPLVRRTRATLRRAAFGFFGVWVYTRVQTPRFCGQPCSAGLAVLYLGALRPARTNW